MGCISSKASKEEGAVAEAPADARATTEHTHPEEKQSGEMSQRQVVTYESSDAASYSASSTRSSTPSEEYVPPGSPQVPWFMDTARLNRHFTSFKRFLSSEIITQPHLLVEINNLGIEDNAARFQIIADEGFLLLDLYLKPFTRDRENKLGHYNLVITDHTNKVIEKSRGNAASSITLAQAIVLKIRQHGSPVSRPRGDPGPFSKKADRKSVNPLSPEMRSLPQVSDSPRVVQLEDIFDQFKDVLRAHYPGLAVAPPVHTLDNLQSATELRPGLEVCVVLEKVGSRSQFEFQLNDTTGDEVRLVARHTSQYHDAEHFQDSLEKILCRVPKAEVSATDMSSADASSSLLDSNSDNGSYSPSTLGSSSSMSDLSGSSSSASAPSSPISPLVSSSAESLSSSSSF